MVELISMILFYIIIGISLWCCYDAFIVDEEIEKLIQQRNFIRNVYNKILSMSLKDIRGFLDATEQYETIIKLNEISDTVVLSFNHYVVTFEHSSDYASIEINNIIIYTGEDFQNHNNKYTIEHCYDILKYLKFDEIICARNGLFLDINEIRSNI